MIAADAADREIAAQIEAEPADQKLGHEQVEEDREGPDRRAIGMHEALAVEEEPVEDHHEGKGVVEDDEGIVPAIPIEGADPEDEVGGCQDDA